MIRPPEWRQRCGIRPEKYLPSRTNRECVWFHASSMGEVRVLERLLETLKAKKPGMVYCVSTYTRTGCDLARQVFPDAEAVFFFPLDCWFSWHRIFSYFTPSGLVIVETEIWPYGIDFCRRLKIPIILANGRLTEKSLCRYQPFAPSLSRLLTHYSNFLVQTEADAERFARIGAPLDKIIILGNIKHDLPGADDRAEKRRLVRTGLNLADETIFFLAASTRPGEEEIVLSALEKIPVFPEAMTLLLAPRHLERLEEVRKILTDRGLTYTPYSEIAADGFAGTGIILLDKMGFLAELFYGGDIAFVGGTLADLGGHNIMEPVLAGIPVLFGPSVFNVTEASRQVIEGKQGMMIKDADTLTAAIEDFRCGRLRFEVLASGTARESVAAQTAHIIIREFDL